MIIDNDCYPYVDGLLYCAADDTDPTYFVTGEDWKQTLVWEIADYCELCSMMMIWSDLFDLLIN